MTKKRRFLIGLLAMGMLLAILSSILFLCAASDHTCRGEDCAVCLQIGACENLLKALGLAAAATVFAAALTWFLTRSVLSCPEDGRVLTLVSLKVELLN